MQERPARSQAAGRAPADALRESRLKIYADGFQDSRKDVSTASEVSVVRRPINLAPGLPRVQRPTVAVRAAGDRALRELGELVNKALRAMDTLGRWGGEEFVVVLPEIDAEHAMTIAERVRQTIAAHLFDIAGGTHLTVSLGVATYPHDGSTRGALLDAADRAMYAAKWLGRNQTFSASDPVVTSIESSRSGSSTPDEQVIMGAVDALALLVDIRDKGTSEHSLHVAKLVQRLALELDCTPEQAR